MHASFPAHGSSLSKDVFAPRLSVLVSFSEGLRNTHLQSPYFSFKLRPVDTVPGLLRRRRGTRRLRRGHLRFLHADDSPSSLTMKDQSDVGSLSRRVMLQPVSGRLQPGIGFFRPPNPAGSWVSLAAYFPVGNPTGLPRSVYGVHGVRCQLSTGMRCWLRAVKCTSATDIRYRLVQANQPLALVYVYGLYH